MPPTQDLPATDSATDLHRILGDDATATFENDPNFVDSNPTGNASSENVEEQRSAAGATPSARDTDDTEDADDDEDEDDVDEDEDLDGDEDEEDDDEDDLDDETDEDDDEDELDDDDDDEDDEDDADEVKASSVLHADGLLGYEDEAEDVKNGVSREKGDRTRAQAEEELSDGEKNYDPNSQQDGKWLPVERDDTPEAEGALIENRNTDPNFVPPYRAAAEQHAAS